VVRVWRAGGGVGRSRRSLIGMSVGGDGGFGRREAGGLSYPEISWTFTLHWHWLIDATPSGPGLIICRLSRARFSSKVSERSRLFPRVASWRGISVCPRAMSWFFLWKWKV